MNKMILGCLLLFGNLLFTDSAVARQVTQETAQTVALNFFKAHNAAISTTITAGLVYQQNEADNSVDYFIFNIEPLGGFVIVSGNYNTSPVIAYSLESKFASDTDHEAGISAWMIKSAQKIHSSFLKNLPQDQNILDQWNQCLDKSLSASAQGTGVGPLLTTTWNQSRSGNPASAAYYYNLLCPATGSQHSLAGCNAIALAQIINYWQYPAQGIGSNSYTPSGYTTQTVDFTATQYRWNVMPRAITASNFSSDGALALDTLIYQCGVAVNMGYSPTNSWSYLYGTPSALYAYVNYFGYDQSSIQYSLDTLVTDSMWLAIIENELNNGRVVQYRGADQFNGAAHIWVCDGYDASDFLHMNWGWGGQDNGFYQVGALSPGGDRFNVGDMALIGIHPPGQPTRPALGISTHTLQLTGLQLYPNPANEMLTISVSSSDQYSNSSMTIYDALGRIMSSQKMGISQGENKFQLDISPLSAGDYTLSLQNGSNVSSAKFVKAD